MPVVARNILMDPTNFQTNLHTTPADQRQNHCVLQRVTFIGIWSSSYEWPLDGKHKPENRR